MSCNLTHYKSWSSTNVVQWIISTNPTKFEKYRSTLNTSLVANHFRGADMADLDRADLKQYGIINLNDRKTIYKSITKLVAKYKNVDSVPRPILTQRKTANTIVLISGYVRVNQPNLTINNYNSHLPHLIDAILHFHGPIVGESLPNQHFYGNGGWLPSKAVVSVWENKILNRAQACNASLHSSVQALAKLIDTNEIIHELTIQMIQQYSTQHCSNDVEQSRIENVNHMLQSINSIIRHAPQFHGQHLIGVPLAALFTGINSTLAGQTLFRINAWNRAIQSILKAWGAFLYTKESFPAQNSWLSASAKEKWAPEPIGMDLWVLPKQQNPYWDSWNAFFGRDINRKYRPLAGMDNNEVITSANDGGLVRISKNIKLTDTFWLKDMPYSLRDIFGGIDHKLSKSFAKRFINGCIFQTFLSPFSYHCWWAPVSGTIIHKSVLPGLYYSKLVTPDYSGTTTASCPYLLQVNARGILIIDTKDTIDIGLVCCIPIGMCEVSSIVFEAEHTNVNQRINKGQKLGRFAFGGSSFAILFEDVSKYNKCLTFNRSFSRINMAQNLNSVDGQHSIPINVGSKIAVVSTVFRDREGNTFRRDTLSNRLDLFDETVELISQTFPVAEPSCKCANVSYEEVYYWTKTYLNKMRDNALLDFVSVVLNIENDELAFVSISSDLFEDRIDLDANEMKELSNKGQGGWVRVLQFAEAVQVNGIRQWGMQLSEKYAHKLRNREKGHFFHLYIGGANLKYAGKGATPLMYKTGLQNAQKRGYSYLCQEATNPISQHLAKKYGNAKTLAQVKFSDYFENYKKAGIATQQTAMFQVIDLKTKSKI